MMANAKTQRWLRGTVCAVGILLAAATPGLALDDPQTKLVDPMATGMWDYHQVGILGDPANITFDERVIVSAPSYAEDSFNVPVLVDATAIENVKRIVLFVDYGPIPEILTFYPGKALARLGFRFKIDQSTPVRAAVETSAGRWYVGQTKISAAGGGCTAPAVAHSTDDWEEHLGEVNGLVWAGEGRVRAIIDHPMDTGLADGIPVFILEDMSVNALDGTELSRLELHEPVNEDPAFTFFFPENTLDDELRILARDNNGNRVDAVIGSKAIQ